MSMRCCDKCGKLFDDVGVVCQSCELRKTDLEHRLQHITQLVAEGESLKSAIEISNLRRSQDSLYDAAQNLRNEINRLTRELAEMTRQRDDAQTALKQINEVRNSIVGLQTINWSEHVYPLVAALDVAGIVGMEYPEAKANFGTAVKRAVDAERENVRLRGLIAGWVEEIDEVVYTPNAVMNVLAVMRQAAEGEK